MTKKGNATSGWYYNDKNTMHHVSAYDGVLVRLSRCGQTAGTSWKEDPNESSEARMCKRCQMLIAKDVGRDEPSEDKDAPLPAETSSVAFNMQVVGEMTPVAYVPVPDLEEVIRLLEASKPSEIAVLARNVREAAIIALKNYIDEANKRAAIPVSTTWTYTGGNRKK